MKKSYLNVLTLIVAVMFLFSINMSAQMKTGKTTSYVMDDTKAPLMGASVTELHPSYQVNGELYPMPMAIFSSRP